MRVYLTQPIAEGALARLREAAEVTMNDDPLHMVTREELVAGLRRSDVLFCLLHDRVDGSVLEAVPELRLIASMAIHPANVDVPAATARGIPVTVIPPLVTEATADVAFALLLAVVRRVVEADGLLRSGVFPGSQSSYLVGGTVHGKVLGIVGLGGIGAAMARRARGFGMPVLYTKRHRLSAAVERDLGVTFVPLDRLLEDADVVSIHAPQTPETHHLIGERELRRMKPTAYLINTSRGPLVDEAALLRALAEGWIAGAGLDVYEHEPRVSAGLVGLKNVVLTPHIGSAERETRETIAGVVVDNILAFARGDRPPNVCNPEVYAR
ncbi:MAG TPA: NAD(P)-dependent oxidoreductase [bacterium]|nr:NAD(P)-dependent oxidoreductase [bacterium]